MKFDETKRIETSQVHENNKGKEKVIEEEDINTSIIEIPSSIRNNLDYELSTNVTPQVRNHPTSIRKKI